MSTSKVVRGVKQFTLATGGQKALCIDEKGIRLLCEGKGISANSYKVEKEKILPFGSYQMRTPVSQDIVTCICVAKSGDKGFVGCLSGRITPLSSGGAGDNSWSAHASKVTGMYIIEKNGKMLLWSCSTDGFLKIWEGNRAIAKASGHRGDVYDLAYAPFASGGGIIWSCGFDKTVRVWDKHGNAAAGVGSGRRPTSLKCSDAVTSLAADPEHNVVWSCDKSNVRAWSADTRICVWCSTRGGTVLALVSKYVVTLTDNGANIAVYNRKMTNTDAEVPPVTVFAAPEKSCNKVLPVSMDRLAISSGHGIHLLVLEETKIDVATEMVIEKAKHESVGVIFKNEKILVLERVEPGSAAERCGATRFLGWQLSHVNGSPVGTVPDVIAAIKKQHSFLCKFKQPNTGNDNLQVPVLVKRQLSGNALKRKGSTYNAKPAVDPPSPVITNLGAPVVPVPDFSKKEKKTHSKPVNPIIHAASPPSSPQDRTPSSPISPLQRHTPTPTPVYAELLAAVRNVTGSSAPEAELPGILMAHVTSLKDEYTKYKLEVASHISEKDGQILELTKQNSNSQLGMNSSMRDMIRECIESSMKKGFQPIATSMIQECIESSIVKNLKPLATLDDIQRMQETLSESACDMRQLQETLVSLRSQTSQGSLSAPEQPDVPAQPTKPPPAKEPKEAKSLLTEISVKSTTPPHQTDNVKLAMMLTRCGDALSSLYSVAGASEWVHLETASVEDKVDALLKGLRNLHTEICHKDAASAAGSPDMSVMNQLTGLLSSRLTNGERENSLAGPKDLSPLPPRSVGSSRERHVPTARMSTGSATLTMSQGSAPLTPPRRRHDPPPPEYLSETTDIRQSPSPLIHMAIPPSTEEDAQWGKLFEMRNRLEQWLQWKPKQLTARAAQAKREALEKGVRAVDTALEELDAYHSGERLEYESMWEEVQEGLGSTSPHGQVENLTKGWVVLEGAEEALFSTLEKLRKEYGDPQTVLASVRNKLTEFRQFIEETTRELNAATQKYSDSVKDADIYKCVIRAVGVDAWCRARKHVQFLDLLEAQVDGIEGAHVALAEAKAVGHSWAALEMRLVGPPPASELQGHIEFVLAVLQLARAVTQLQVDPEIACSAAEDVMGNLVVSHQQMILRLKDVESEDDTLLALETLCDEILRYYTLALQPMLEQDGKNAARTNELSEALIRAIRSDCKLRSHHVPRHQLDVMQVTAAVAKVCNQEFPSTAVSLSVNDVDAMFAQSLTKGGSIVVMNTFCRTAAFHLIKLNQMRYPQHQRYSLDTPRTSLDSLFSFFSSRIRTP